MHRLRLRDRQWTLRPGLAILAIVATLIALALALPAAASATVTFAVNYPGSGEGEVECNIKEPGEALEEGLFCDGTYPLNTQITVLPTAEEGSKFAGFENGTGSATGCTGKKTPCTFTITANSSVAARFDLVMYTLNINYSGSGDGEVECEVEGVADFCEPEYPEDTELTLVPVAEEGSEFTGFKNGIGSAAGCTGTDPCAFTIEANSSVDAQFDLITHTLGVSKVGTGSGTVTSFPGGINCGSGCSAKYGEGTTVTLTATPALGSTFADWSGDCESNPAPNKCVVTLEEVDATATATFALNEYTLTVETTGPGSVSGSPGPSPCGSVCPGTFPHGTVVTLTAAPSPGSFFSGWAGGGCKGIGKTCTLTINGDTTVAAEFAAIPPPDPEEELLEVEAGTARAAGAAQVKAGKAALKLTCSDGPCKGTLKLTAKFKQGKKTKTLVIGQASFKLAEDASKTLKVKLSGPAKRALGKGKTIKAKLSGTGIAASTVKLKPA